MNKYKYICDGCGNEVPELLTDVIEGFRHHTVGEKQPEPCGPIREVLIIENPPKPWSPCQYEINGSYCEICEKGVVK